MNRYGGICLALLFVLSACDQLGKDQKGSAESGDSESTYYTEKYRPQYHFSPEEKWMNDPNGLIFHEGKYHLFYQYYPEDIVWGPMHWGHAVSSDMHRWEHKPIALYPDEHGLIFSGSAVLDKNNTSGFGQDGEQPLVAVYTYHLMKGEQEGRTDFQTQGIAYSLDGGDTWTKYEGNPVIPNTGIKDFRDPKVFWHEQSEQWVMVLVAGDHAQVFLSPDLKAWTYSSSFGKNQGAHGGVWECPDLFLLPVEGTEEERWVMTISINPGAPNGGSGTQYFIGDFDGKTFTSDQKETLWLDYGTDNYAGVTYNNTPNNRRIFIGWMSNWEYARQTPTEVWRSAMTLPRTLSLVSTEEGIRLRQQPLMELHSLETGTEVAMQEVPSSSERDAVFTALQQSKISLHSTSDNFHLVLSNDSGDELVYKFNQKTGSVLVDRIQSGVTDFNPEFGNRQHYMPLASQQEVLEVDLYMDQSSAELFINRGMGAMTSQVFPRSPYTKMTIKNLSPSGVVEGIEVKELDNVWRKNPQVD